MIKQIERTKKRGNKNKIIQEVVDVKEFTFEKDMCSTFKF